MRYYLDTEFNENGKTIDLISIALVADDGRELYCVSSEFSPVDCNDWVRQNVIPQLPIRDWWIDKGLIRERVRRFLSTDPKPEFWAYFADYDWVLFCQLFGSMEMLPDHYPNLCMDIMQYAIDTGCDQRLKEILPMDHGEHDALADARWNKAIHQILMDRWNHTSLAE